MRFAAAIRIPVLLSLAFSCAEKQGSAIDEAYVQSNLLTTVPDALDSEAQADFDGKLLYLGNEVATTLLAPGGAGSIVHYWRVVEPPGSEWKFFTHLNGDANEWMNLDTTDMRTGYPASKWKAGDIIRDEQKFTLAKTWMSTSATMSVGLYRKGSQGVGDRMPIASGAHDKENRSPVYTFSVPSGGASVPKETLYVVRKTLGPLILDGKADEDSWKNATMSPNFSDAEGGKAVGATTQARLLWDDEYLYAFVQIADKDIFSQFHKRDDTLWKEDVIEFFIDADRNRRGYIELQVNPNNAHFDAWFPRTRGHKHHFEWNSGMKSAVQIHGTADKRSDVDQGWDVEVAIPLRDVKGMANSMQVALPPRLGDRWRLNVIRGEKPEKSGLAASSWNPITIRDFHALDRMLTVVFADSKGMAKAPAPPAKKLDTPSQP